MKKLAASLLCLLCVCTLLCPAQAQEGILLCTELHAVMDEAWADMQTEVKAEGRTDSMSHATILHYMPKKNNKRLFRSHIMTTGYVEERPLPTTFDEVNAVCREHVAMAAAYSSFIRDEKKVILPVDISTMEKKVFNADGKLPLVAFQNVAIMTDPDPAKAWFIIPFAFKKDDGVLYNDAIYLCVFTYREMVDTLPADSPAQQIILQGAVHGTVISDQKLMFQILSHVWGDLEQMPYNHVYPLMAVLEARNK